MSNHLKDRRKPLTQKELEEAILNLSDSEDDFDSSSVENEDFCCDKNLLSEAITGEDKIDILPSEDSDDFDIENIPIVFLENSSSNECIPKISVISNILLKSSEPNSEVMARDNSYSVTCSQDGTEARDESQKNSFSLDDSSSIPCNDTQMSCTEINNEVSTPTNRRRQRKVLQEINIETPKRKLRRTCEQIHSPVTKSKTANDIQQLKEKYSKITWTSGNISEFSAEFLGQENLPQIFTEFSSPLEYFSVFFSDDLYKHISEQSTLFATQRTPENPCLVTVADIKKYIGSCVIMSVIHMPSIRSYWSKSIGIDIIKRAMPQKHFEKIRRYMHFNNNEEMLPRDHPNHDRMHKLRPVINHLIKEFQSVPYERDLSVDEQICSTKARSYLKQYMPAKPHKWGYKLFVLSGVSGYVYNFEVYTGQENDSDKRKGQPNLGASANVVVRLLGNVPQQIMHRVYFDNYYTTVPLMVHLKNCGILGLGTVRRNRIPNCILPLEKEFLKEPRGTCHEYITVVDSTEITSVIWKDNKTVTLLSNFCGINPLERVDRYNKQEKRKTSVACPHLVKVYNRHMGGVDLTDSLIGRHKISIKSKKWYMRLFYHLIDMAMVNAWLLYKRALAERNQNSKLLTLADFRVEVATELILCGASIAKSRGRKSNLDKILQERKERSPASYIPPHGVRTDEMGHWPVWMAKRLRCKYPKCKGYTFIQCEKCKASLCLNKNKNCFKVFHT